MNRILNRIFNLIIILIAIVSLIISLRLPFIDQKDILFFSGMALFLILIYLVTHQMTKLEKEMEKLEEKFKRFDDLLNVWKEIEKIKLKIKLKK